MFILVALFFALVLLSNPYLIHKP